MRIATYNVEWFSNLFDDDGNIFDDNRWSGRYDVRRSAQLAALGVVFSALDAVAVLIFDDPDSHRWREGVAALEIFASMVGLRARKAV
ncbi:MAG: endonuclease, partial [Boseongicola sp.]